MRTAPLSKEEKDKVKALFKEMKLIPPQGEVVVNFGKDESISSVEIRGVLR